MTRRSSYIIWAVISGCLLGRDGHSVSFLDFIFCYNSEVCTTVLISNWFPDTHSLKKSFEDGDAVRGRYSHVAAVMDGRVLLIAGGYSGVALGDLVAYKVPLFVSSDQGDRVSEKIVIQEKRESCYWEYWQSFPIRCVKSDRAKTEKIVLDKTS